MKKTTLLAVLLFSSALFCDYSFTQPVSEKYMDITVKSNAGNLTKGSVTNGIPLAEGAAPSGAIFLLKDKNNKPVPCQSQVLATWKDGSVRWVLLDFQADNSQEYKLTWYPGSKEIQPKSPVKTSQGNAVQLSSGPVQLSTVKGSLLRVSDRFDIKLVMKDRQGNRCEGIVKTSKIETKGNMRSTMLLTGSIENPQKDRIIDFRLRASVFSGSTKFYIEPQVLVNADTGIIHYMNNMYLEIIPSGGISNAVIGGDPGWKGTPASPVTLFQVDDANYRLEGNASGKGTTAPGWMEIKDVKGTFAVTLRDFWQQWPKSLEVDSKVAKIGLFPDFKEGEFDHMGPWYKHDYLFSGNSYRLREGQTKRWQIWVDLGGNGELLSNSANSPLIAVPDPVQAIKTGEWGYVAAAGTTGMAEYDDWADSQFEGYCRSIREQRDYGAMNWGDWWGERNCNWGNHEYDTPLHILTQFVRTGDTKYYYVGEQAARHYSEVDVVHFVNPELKQYFSRWESKAYPSRPGMVHEHSIGHVGGFHSVDKIKELYVSLGVSNSPNPYLCLDPFNLGHIFTLGMAHYYFLSGDPWVKETIEKIGDNLMRLTEDGLYQFKANNHCGRVNGWSMLALAGFYKVNQSERCLAAMKHVAEDALSEQNPHCGGWLYKLGWGHCNCVDVNHVGEAGFISSIRLNGLSYYYRLTADERIPNSVLRGVNHLNNDTWNDYKSGWRYTTCPGTSASVSQSGVTIMALVNSISLNGNEEQLRVLRKAWDFKFARLMEAPKTAPGLGKSYSTNMYGSPEAANLFVNGIKK